MKRFAVVAGAALVFLAVAGVALTWAVGRQTEIWFRDNLTPAADTSGAWRIRLTHYERGWVRSTAASRIELRSDATVYADVDHVIDHLPLPGKGWARVRSTPRWAQDVQSAADYYFEQRPAVSVATEVGFGATTIRLDSPPFRKAVFGNPDGSLAWGGAAIALRVRGQRHVVLQAEIPQLTLTDRERSFDLVNLRLDGEWTMGADPFDWQGQSTLEASSIRFTSNGSGAALRHLATAVQQRLAGENVTIGYRAGIAEGEINGNGGAATSFSNARIEIELDRIARGALRKYYEGVAAAAEVQGAGDEAAQMAAGLALQTAGDFLAASPAIRIKTLGVQTSAGELTGSAELSFDGEGFQPELVLPILLGKVRFDASAQVSRSLLTSWLAQTQAAEAEQRLATFIESGLIRAEGNRYATHVLFAQGSLRVNDRPADELLGAFFR